MTADTRPDTRPEPQPEPEHTLGVGSRLIRIDLELLAAHQGRPAPVQPGKHRIERVDTRHITTEERAALLSAVDAQAAAAALRPPTPPATDTTVMAAPVSAAAPVPPPRPRPSRLAAILRNLPRRWVR